MQALTSNRSRSNRSPYDPPDMAETGYSPSMIPASVDAAYAPAAADSPSTGGGNTPVSNFYAGAYAPPRKAGFEMDAPRVTAPAIDKSLDPSGAYSPAYAPPSAPAAAPSLGQNPSQPNLSRD